MLAIVVPCYNEESRFPLDMWCETIVKTKNIEWLFVDDGSKDKTLDILKQFDYPNVSVLSLEKNLGKGNAIRQGILDAKKTFQRTLSAVGYLDCDGAFDFQEVIYITELFERLSTGSDPISCLIASRVKLSGRNVHRNQSRHIISRVLLTLICLRWKFAPYDPQSGFKIFSVTKEFESAILLDFKTRWFFDIELMLRIERQVPLKIWEEPVRNWHDIKGSKVNSSQYFGILKELLLIRHILNHNQIGG